MLTQETTARVRYDEEAGTLQLITPMGFVVTFRDKFFDVARDMIVKTVINGAQIVDCLPKMFQAHA